MAEYSDWSDEEILEKLEKWYKAEVFERSEEWKFIAEACRRASDRASMDLDNVDPKDFARIAELQQIRKLYKDVFRSLINSLKIEGEVAHGEAVARNLVKSEESGSTP